MTSDVSLHGKNGFVTATKLETTNKIFVAVTKHFAAATKRLVDRTKHVVVVTKCFCYPYFNKWFNETFFPVEWGSVSQNVSERAGNQLLPTYKKKITGSRTKNF